MGETPMNRPLVDINETWLRQHRSHDAAYLLERWRRVARAARLRVDIIHETGGYPVYFLTSAKAGVRPLYLSAGVHGDEAGAVLGLLEWAERSIRWLRLSDVVLLPLFNPAGLALNTRMDADGADLNRLFDHPAHPHITGWRAALAVFRPRMAVCLHEDYDARGLYAYELNRDARLRPAEHCLKQAESILPRDPRRVIEGRPAQQAVIRRRRLPMLTGLPEAVALYQAGTPCTLTFETPSEFSLASRVHAQARLLGAVCQWDGDRVQA